MQQEHLPGKAMDKRRCCLVECQRLLVASPAVLLLPKAAIVKDSDPKISRHLEEGLVLAAANRRCTRHTEVKIRWLQEAWEALAVKG